VNSLLDLARIESGEEEHHVGVLDIGEEVRAALVFLRDTAANKNIAVELFLDAGLPRLYADPRKIKQVLVNLLSNAVKYSPPDGRVIVSVRAGELEGFVLEVVDTGPGIAKEDIGTALKPYRRIKKAGRTEPGTGLGLPLTVSFVELHGGELEIDSVLGVGTMVTVGLPWSRAVTEWERQRPAK
jgi:two-component system cell cycle sensor histidine kinase PleC